MKPDRERQNASGFWLPQANVKYGNGFYPAEHRRRPCKMVHAPRCANVPRKLLKPCSKGRDTGQDGELVWKGVAPGGERQLGCGGLRRTRRVRGDNHHQPLTTFSLHRPFLCQRDANWLWVWVGGGVWETTIPVHKYTQTPRDFIKKLS